MSTAATIGGIVIGLVLLQNCGGIGDAAKKTAQEGLSKASEFEGPILKTDPADTAVVAVPKPDAATYARLCPLLSTYFSLDKTGQAVLTKGIITLAEQGQKSTDPSVQAFSDVVPAALGANTAARTAARSLVKRECAANGSSFN